MIGRHVARLTDDQRADSAGRFAGRLTLRKRNRVRVLLRGGRGDADDEAADGIDVRVATVAAGRRRFAADGLGAAPSGRPRSGGPATFDGTVEATTVALARPPTPDGRGGWTAELIAGRLVGLHLVESISARAAGRALKEVGSSRGRRRRGACPAG